MLSRPAARNGKTLITTLLQNNKLTTNARTICDSARLRNYSPAMTGDAGTERVVSSAESIKTSSVSDAAAASGTSSFKETPPVKSGGFLSKLLSPGPDGRSKVLAALGYYSNESRAIAAGTKIYAQAVERAASMVEQVAPPSVPGQRAPFVARYEILAVHVYLALRRLRQEKGKPFESDVAQGMQTLFDVFWTDLRNRMLIQEEGYRLVGSGQWVKECEERFFGMAYSFDECFPVDMKQPVDVQRLDSAIARNITCLKRDATRIKVLRDYMVREKQRQDGLGIVHIWEAGLSWSV